ncbi:helix-turn-helix domain-containing protein [Muricoccus pecuniae]|uniref:helix-turn-helix domain-containing protein n=1 Tax=Muricoccus pecuniae TaxID=693023 RepID=UPI00161AAA35
MTVVMVESQDPTLCTQPYVASTTAGETDAANDRLLTLQEVGDLIGISQRTLRRWRRDGHLQSVRIAGTVRVRASALEQVLCGSSDTAQEIS